MVESSTVRDFNNGAFKAHVTPQGNTITFEDGKRMQGADTTYRPVASDRGRRRVRRRRGDVHRAIWPHEIGEVQRLEELRERACRFLIERRANHLAQSKIKQVCAFSGARPMQSSRAFSM